ncbi:hypothetical protein ACWDV4_17115 [Micromonospora sp. NPDC003197]
MRSRRTLAQRGLAWSHLARAYHVGNNLLREYLFEDLLASGASPDGQLQVLQYATDAAFSYVDAMTHQLHAIYQREVRRRSDSSVSRARALVHAVLSGSDEASELSVQTGYPVAAIHVGLVVWNPEPRGSAMRTLVEPDDVCHSLAATLGAEHVLTVATDEGTTTAWITLPRAAAPTGDQLRAALGSSSPLRVVAGLPLAGDEGFRASHRQALAAYRLAGVADPALAAPSRLDQQPASTT